MQSPVSINFFYSSCHKRPQIAPAQVSFLTSTLRSHGIDLRADVAPEFTITSPIKFGKRTRRVKICKNDDLKFINVN